MPQGEIHVYPTLVKEIYLDSFGHLNNAAYFTLFEEARWDFISKKGYGLEKIRHSGVGPTILEITIRYLRELHARDEIIIQSQVTAYQKKIGKLQQTMLRDGQICCQAEFTIALFDLKERKLIMPTADWLFALGWQDE